MIYPDLSHNHTGTTALLTQSTILIVDDDPSVSTLVRHILEEEGYLVRSVETGAAAESAVSEQRPDLILLDIMLPDADGLMLCTRLLALGPTPIIMLSGSVRDSDRILSLRLGADDFIAKPFDPPELAARVQAVLRRASRDCGGAASSPAPPTATAGPIQAESPLVPGAAVADRPQSQTVTVGELAVDPRRRAVTVSGAPVPLTPTEYRLLTALAGDPERVFSRDELASILWGYDSLGESRAVDVHIRRLRAKLEPFGDTAPPIDTVRGFGYTLRADVVCVSKTTTPQT